MENKNKFYIYIGIILFFVVCFTGGILLGNYAVNHDLSLKFTDFIIMIVVMYVNIFIQINLHEFGHLIVGKLFNYELVSYRIGCLAWDDVNGKLKFSVKKNEDYGGLCAMLPTADIKKYQYALFISGGVIMNTLSVILFTLLFIHYYHTQSFVLLGSLLSCLFITLVMVISNALPVTLGLMPSDGKLFFSLFHKEENLTELFEMFKLMTQMMSGTRPSDLMISSEMNELSDELNQVAFIKLLFGYFKFLDLKDREQMQIYIQKLETNLHLVPLTIAPGIYYELIYYYLVVDDQPDKAAQYYEKIKGQLLKDIDVNGCRINCTCSLYLDHDLEKALEWFELGVRVADKFKLKGQAVLELELLNYLKNEIDLDYIH